MSARQPTGRAPPLARRNLVRHARGEESLPGDPGLVVKRQPRHGRANRVLETIGENSRLDPEAMKAIRAVSSSARIAMLAAGLGK